MSNSSSEPVGERLHTHRLLFGIQLISLGLPKCYQHDYVTPANHRKSQKYFKKYKDDICSEMNWSDEDFESRLIWIHDSITRTRFHLRFAEANFQATTVALAAERIDIKSITDQNQYLAATQKIYGHLTHVLNGLRVPNQYRLSYFHVCEIMNLFEHGELSIRNCRSCKAPHVEFLTLPGHPSECSACNTTPCRHDWKQSFLRPSPNLKRGVASVWLGEEQKPTPKGTKSHSKTSQKKPAPDSESTSVQHMGAKGVGNDADFDKGAGGGCEPSYKGAGECR